MSHLAAWQKHTLAHFYWTANKITAETRNRSAEVLGGDSGYSPSCDGKSITITFSCAVLVFPMN